MGTDDKIRKIVRPTSNGCVDLHDWTANIQPCATGSRLLDSPTTPQACRDGHPTECALCGAKRAGCYSEPGSYYGFEYVDRETGLQYDGPPLPCRAVPNNCELGQAPARFSSGDLAYIPVVRLKGSQDRDIHWGRTEVEVEY